VIPKESERGYFITYRRGEDNTCPGCGRRHWLVGRTMAECAFCSTALPFEETHFGGGRVQHRRAA
jgi:hypothetical protein